MPRNKSKHHYHAKPYAKLLSNDRLRASGEPGRSLEEEANSDRGRVLFSAPFRRLQDKAQVFSLESNASVRSRLTHSLEVASIGTFVAQQALTRFTRAELADLGLEGSERPFCTFVETACLLHDLGNPPFGHFGELEISSWFEGKKVELSEGVGPKFEKQWQDHYSDFTNFDGNPQGFRIAAKLQASNTHDLYGLNLTATTLAATIKYPWNSSQILPPRKKAGYFRSEEQTKNAVCSALGLKQEQRHPLAYLMEAADDIAYCISDIEDGIEKGLISGVEFSNYLKERLKDAPVFSPKLKVRRGDAATVKDIEAIWEGITKLKNAYRTIDGAKYDKLTAMNAMDILRSAAIRLMARQAGSVFYKRHCEIVNDGKEFALLREKSCIAKPLLDALNGFAKAHLYVCPTVLNREITAHAVLSGLLDAYLPILKCDTPRFTAILDGKHNDLQGRLIARETSLISRIARKYLAVYREEVRRVIPPPGAGKGYSDVMEKLYRIRMIVDYVSGMTDKFALQTYQLISGAQVGGYTE